ncbi:MAG: hypothetical protein ACFFE8_14930 [Candidatus Heimdallarchaeota archaeon]
MVEYRHYEPDKGYEELQAKIYNEANPMNYPPATAEQILDRYKEENFDRKMVRYAFVEGDMIAYIQARRHPSVNEIHLSFPWALKGCSPEIQDRLFSDLLNYCQENFPNARIRVNLPGKPEKNVHFLQQKGFIEKNRWYQYFVELEDISKLKYDEARYTSRIASEMDVDSIIDLIKTDGRYQSNFKTDSEIENYLIEKVLAVGHLVIIMDQGKLTAAGAPLLYKLPLREKEVVILRFTAFRESKTRETFRHLLIEVARECLRTGYGLKHQMSLYSDQMETPPLVRSVIEELHPKGEVAFYYFYLEEKS